MKSWIFNLNGKVQGKHNAENEELLRHYMDVFHAEYLGMIHQYQFFIDEEQAKCGKKLAELTKEEVKKFSI